MNDITMKLLNMLLQDQLAGGDQIRPCLYGGTGTGKTSVIRHELSQLDTLKDYPLYRINLGATLPEDLTGLPSRNHETRVTDYYPLQAMEALSKKPGVLFFDELGHAMDENIPPVLTLLYEGRVQDLTLHPQTIIVCAMQPVEIEVWKTAERYKALAARLCFLPMQNDWGYVERECNAPGLTQAWTTRDTNETFDFPTQKANSRTVSWVLNTYKKHSNMSKEERARLFRGVLLDADATIIEDWIDATGWGIDIESLIKAGKAKDVFSKLSLHEVVIALPLLWLHGKKSDLSTLTECLVRIEEHKSRELSEQAIKTLYEKFKEAATATQQIEVFGDATPADLGEAFHNAVKELGRRNTASTPVVTKSRKRASSVKAEGEKKDATDK